MLVVIPSPAKLLWGKNQPHKSITQMMLVAISRQNHLLGNIKSFPTSNHINVSSNTQNQTSLLTNKRWASAIRSNSELENITHCLLQTSLWPWKWVTFMAMQHSESHSINSGEIPTLIKFSWGDEIRKEGWKLFFNTDGNWYLTPKKPWWLWDAVHGHWLLTFALDYQHNRKKGDTADTDSLWWWQHNIM